MIQQPRRDSHGTFRDLKKQRRDSYGTFGDLQYPRRDSQQPRRDSHGTVADLRRDSHGTIADLRRDSRAHNDSQVSIQLMPHGGAPRLRTNESAQDGEVLQTMPDNHQRRSFTSSQRLSSRNIVAPTSPQGDARPKSMFVSMSRRALPAESSHFASHPPSRRNSTSSEIEVRGKATSIQIGGGAEPSDSSMRFRTN